MLTPPRATSVPYGFDLGTKGGTSGGPFVQGINEAVIGMRVGGQRRAIVPPALAYGDFQVQEIAPNSTLQFDIELLSIKGDLPKATLF
jgi:FKBP-type peptidyl-prolyl cis-trans isomerase